MLDRLFPGLPFDGYTVTSSTSVRYNCIAWAAGDDTQRWEPDPLQYFHWPDGVPREQTIDAFVQAFATLGYEECSSEAIEPGFEKVVLYVRLNIPQHVARQKDNGEWTSKLGDLEDITHTLRGLEGIQYGNIVKILRRKKL